jgi:hypothetical protein
MVMMAVVIAGANQVIHVGRDFSIATLLWQG